MKDNESLENIQEKSVLLKRQYKYSKSKSWNFLNVLTLSLII